MVRQTLINERTNGNAAGRAARNSSHIAHNLLSLARLQGRLFLADLRDSQRSLKTSLLLVIIGAVAFLGSLPVALIATAEALRYWGMPLVGAYFTAAGIGLLIAAIAIPLAWKFFRRSLEVFRRSTSELQRNVESVQEMLGADDAW